MTEISQWFVDKVLKMNTEELHQHVFEGVRVNLGLITENTALKKRVRELEEGKTE